MELLKVPSLASLSTDIGTSASTGTTIALTLCGTVVAIGLVNTIYKVIHNTGSREALIGWIAAVLVYGFAVTYVLGR